MIHLTFTEEERVALERERYEHPHPKVQRRMEAVHLKSCGVEHQMIRTICGITKSTLVSYLRCFEAEGVEGLKRLRYEGRPNGLKEHEESLEEYFQKNPPKNCAQARKMIYEKTGVLRSLTPVRNFLHRLKMKYLKTGFVPGKANHPQKQAEQEEFLKKNSNRNYRRQKRVSGWSFS